MNVVEVLVVVQLFLIELVIVYVVVGHQKILLIIFKDV